MKNIVTFTACLGRAASSVVAACCVLVAVDMVDADGPQGQQAKTLAEDAKRLDGRWVRPAIKEAAGAVEIIPILQFDVGKNKLKSINNEFPDSLGIGFETKGGGEEYVFGPFRLDEQDSHRFIVLGTQGKTRIEYTFKGESLQLARPKKLGQRGGELPDDFDYNGEWTRKM